MRGLARAVLKGGGGSLTFLDGTAAWKYRLDLVPGMQPLPRVRMQVVAREARCNAIVAVGPKVEMEIQDGSA